MAVADANYKFLCVDIGAEGGAGAPNLVELQLENLCARRCNINRQTS